MYAASQRRSVQDNEYHHLAQYLHQKDIILLTNFTLPANVHVTPLDSADPIQFLTLFFLMGSRLCNREIQLSCDAFYNVILISEVKHLRYERNDVGG